MKLSPYLIVENVAQAAEFYQSVFGGEIKVLNQQKEQVLHAEVHVSESMVLHISSNYGKPFSNENVNLLLTFEDPSEQQRVYDALSVDGDPHMPITKTFFNAMHGQVRDQFGVNWLSNCFSA
ncbi:VOC family protein [Staphylococcus simulans]|uniref:VOC family protein n=1 Tax=Staphylococcus simulans TaxID=1286 RepID=UPI00399A3E97